MLTKTKNNKTTSFWCNTLNFIGNFIEEHPKLSLGIFVLTLAGTGGIYGYLLGPAGLFFGTTVGAVAAAKQTSNQAKSCAEYWQDPNNNCNPIDFAAGIKSIEHFDDGGGVIKSVYPMGKDACAEFDKDVKLAAALDPAQDTTSSCRSTGSQECSCEARYTKPKFAAF